MNKSNLPSDTKESHEAKKGDNYDFVQVSRQYLSAHRKLTRKNSIASEILDVFVEHMGKTTNAVVCSYKTLEELLGVSRATVGRAVKVLKDDHWVESIKIGSATAYCVNARVYWQAKRSQKKYAMFQATVIASESEQEQSYLNSDKLPLTHIPYIGENERIVIDQQEKLSPPDQQDLDLT